MSFTACPRARHTHTHSQKYACFYLNYVVNIPCKPRLCFIFVTSRLSLPSIADREGIQPARPPPHCAMQLPSLCVMCACVGVSFSFFLSFFLSLYVCACVCTCVRARVLLRISCDNGLICMINIANRMQTVLQLVSL